MNSEYYNRDGVTRYQSSPPNNRKGGYDSESHAYNVDRIIMERSNVFNEDTQQKKYNKEQDHSHSDSMSIGEITGQKYDKTESELGMPMRQFINEQDELYKKHIAQEQGDPEFSRKVYNPKLDFDLYDQKPVLNVSYHDPYNNQNSTLTNFSSVNDNNNYLLPAIDGVDPETKFSNIINKFCWKLLYLFQNILQNVSRNVNNKYCILTMSPLCILAPIITLYRGSKNTTEQEIRSVFSLLDKDTSFRSMLTLVKKINALPSFISTTAICIPNTYPLNRAFINFTDDLSNVIPIDRMNPMQETIRVNNILRKLTKNTINNTITPNMINMNTGMILISTLYFHSQWNFSWDNVVTRIFRGSPNRKLSFMYARNKIFRYHEDNINQILELDYINNICMGIILPKVKHNMAINMEQYKYYMSELKPTKIYHLQIPKFAHRARYGMVNLFKQLKLPNLFTNADLSDITPSTNILYISDIVHHIVITVDEYGSPKKSPVSKNNGSVSFIANHPFIFYIRYKPTNTIIINGQFY